MHGRILSPIRGRNKTRRYFRETLESGGERPSDVQIAPHLTRLRRAGYDVSVIRRIFRSPRLLAGFMIVLLLPPSVSTLVWCHKPDGRTEIERENKPGECVCHECEHGREHSSTNPREVSPSRPALKADHCHHEAAAAEAPAVLLENKSSQNTDLSVGVPISREPGLALPEPFIRQRIVAILLSSGPPDSPLLSFRC
jgi:hypothetical protein